MTHAELAVFMKQVDLPLFYLPPYDGMIKKIAQLAELIAAEEREACADICDSEASCEGIAQKCAALIRARSEK